MITVLKRRSWSDVGSTVQHKNLVQKALLLFLINTCSAFWSPWQCYSCALFGWDVLCVLRHCLSPEALVLMSWQLGTKAADGAASWGQVFPGCAAAGDVALHANQERNVARGGAVLDPLGWSVQESELPFALFPR